MLLGLSTACNGCMLDFAQTYKYNQLVNLTYYSLKLKRNRGNLMARVRAGEFAYIQLNYHCIARYGMQLAFLRSDLQIGVDV